MFDYGRLDVLNSINLTGNLALSGKIEFPHGLGRVPPIAAPRSSCDVCRLHEAVTGRQATFASPVGRTSDLGSGIASGA
jgi:hypothetical protein